MCTGDGLDQLRSDAYALAGLAHRSLQEVADTQLLPDLLHVNGLALVGEARIAGDNEEPTNATERGDDLLDMPSAKYSCSGSPLILAKGRTAIDGLSGSGSGALVGTFSEI